MHPYLQSIGFQNQMNFPDEWEFLRKIQRRPSVTRRFPQGEEVIRETMTKSFGEGMGVTVSGVRYKGRFHREFYYPYVKSECVIPMETCTIMRQRDTKSFLAACGTMRFGVGVIFFVDNFMDVLDYWDGEEEQVLKICGVSLSGLATSGKILLPLRKTSKERVMQKRDDKRKSNHFERISQGDEFSMLAMNCEDMEIYERISNRLDEDDLYTMVDTSFIPSNMETDCYTVLGEILSLRLEKNTLTGEEIYMMVLRCHLLEIQVAVPQAQLMGKPEVGRRFKGDIWLQGSLFL